MMVCTCINEFLLSVADLGTSELQKHTENYFKTGVHARSAGPGSAFDCDRYCKILRLAYFQKGYQNLARRQLTDKYS